VRGRARAIVLALAAAACSPRAPALGGVPAPVRIPQQALAPGHRKIVFDFVYQDPDLTLRGEGVARTAAPDSVRLDFFVNNESVGNAIIVGDALLQARPKIARQLLPPLPFLWAAMGVFRVPSAADTIARVDSDTLRIEIAGHPAWRATFMDSELLRLDQIDDGRIPRTVVRTGGAAGARVKFAEPRAQRSLEITLRQVDTLPPFDAAIWR
jgi:hypothetical protein